MSANRCCSDFKLPGNGSSKGGFRHSPASQQMSASLIGCHCQAPCFRCLSSSPRGSRFSTWSALRLRWSPKSLARSGWRASHLGGWLKSELGGGLNSASPIMSAIGCKAAIQGRLQPDDCCWGWSGLSHQRPTTAAFDPKRTCGMAKWGIFQRRPAYTFVGVDSGNSIQMYLKSSCRIWSFLFKLSV